MRRRAVAGSVLASAALLGSVLVETAAVGRPAPEARPALSPRAAVTTESGSPGGLGGPAARAASTWAATSPCGTAGGRPDPRVAGTRWLLDGHGHTLRQTCFEKRLLRQDGTGYLDSGTSRSPAAAPTGPGRR